MASRRDIKTLTAVIAETQEGDRIRAGFSTPRYGEFTVEATVVAGPDQTLTVGDWPVAKAGKPSKGLQEIVILASSGKHPYAVGAVPEPAAEELAA